MERTSSIVSASRRRLVRPVALDAGEAEREPARVPRARLHAVERDLDDELRSDVNRVAVGLGLQLEQALRLPREHVVGHALERLAEHDESAAVRIAGAEVEVRELAVATTVTPLGGEHDEVERRRALHLQPRRAATPGLVRRSRAPSPSALRDRVRAPPRGTARPPAASAVSIRGVRSSCGIRLASSAMRSRSGLVEHVLAVEMEAVEEERCQRHSRSLRLDRGRAPEPAHRDLEWVVASRPA